MAKSKKNEFWKKYRKELGSFGDDKKRQRKLLADFDKKGWSDRELFSFDMTIAKWLAPRLRRLVEIKFKNKDEMDFAFDGDAKEYEELYAEFMELVEGFECIANKNNESLFVLGGASKGSSKEDKDKTKKAERALELFPKLFFSLWY